MAGWGTPHQPNPAEILASAIEKWDSNRCTKNEEALVDAARRYRKFKKGLAFVADL